jgi:hypothetical protein
VNGPARPWGFTILHFFALEDKPASCNPSMFSHSLSLSLALCAAVLSSVVDARSLGGRKLEDSPAGLTSGIPVAAVVGIAAAAAAAVAVLVVMKVRGAGTGGDRRPKDLELHEVVISPSQPAAQPLSTSKQFVYTAHI